MSRPAHRRDPADPADTSTPATDAALVADLTTAVRGEVDASDRRRAEYSADASNYRHVPRVVVFPLDAADVVAAVAVCRRTRTPVTVRGGGTSIAGNAIGSGVVLDLSRHLTRIVAIDPVRRTARVEPGVVLDDLNAAAASYGLRFGPDPSTHSRCTIGGMIGNDACGSRSLGWGRTSDNVVDLDVLCPDGTRMSVGSFSSAELERRIAAGGREGRILTDLRDLADRHRALLRTSLGRFRRQVSGYPLDQLLPEKGRNVARSVVGTEGTCVLVLGATLRLVPVPAHRRLVVFGFRDIVAAAEAVPGLLEHRPRACEGMDRALVEVLRRHRPGLAVDGALPPGDAWLLIEFDGTNVDELDQRVADAARSGTVVAATGSTVVKDAAVAALLWRIREDGAGLATRSSSASAESWPGWEDAAVPPERLGAYLRELSLLLERYGLNGAAYGHFGEGCIHQRIDFDLRSPAGIRTFRQFVTEAASLVVGHGGSLSGEHGDGQARGELLPLLYEPRLIDAFAEFKAVWDPEDLMNPGIAVRPRLLDADLRVAAQPVALRLVPAFAFSDDDGDPARAFHRCVGVGKCRSDHGGVMCPSYRATRDEKDSTRGRARVLAEMAGGTVIRDGWRSAAVRESLDLCLGCKGCKTDCPVGVDMAKYKSEFLYHHYRGRLRPLAHYSMGWLPVLARIASTAPAAVNAVLSSRFAGLLKRMGGVAGNRPLPLFARRSLTRWFGARPRAASSGQPRVVLWPDTFSNYFTAEAGVAAVEVLEAAGYAVQIPAGAQCCGLTWVSTGQLGIARRVLRRALTAVAAELDAGTPVVCLEPSCASLLRSDLPELLPDDPRAARLAASVSTLAEFLARVGLPELAREPDSGPAARPTVIQPHCHLDAADVARIDAGLLGQLGRVASTLDTGCCGLAGHFGFERAHSALSRKVAEHALLPALAGLDPGTTVVADGFSCRTQISHLTGRTARHLAEVVRDALGKDGTASG